MSKQIVLSALGPSITEQVLKMGLEHKGSLKFLDRLADAATLLHLHGMLTDSEVNRTRTRIVKQLKLRKIKADSSGLV